MSVCSTGTGFQASFKSRVIISAMASDPTAFGEKIEALLARHGWTQDRLSEATEPNVSQGQISNYKYGRRSPSRETVRVIARAFVSQVKGDATDKERQYRLTVNELLTAAGFSEDYPGENKQESRPMLAFVQQSIMRGRDGDVVQITPEQADQLADELEELASVRISHALRETSRKSG